MDISSGNELVLLTRITHYSLFTTHGSQRTLKSKLAIDLEITFSWI